MGRIYVYMIESPSDADCLDGYYEGNLLINALKIMNIHSYYRLAVNRSTFTEAINRMQELIQARHVPFLHLSAHGNPEGILLTDRSFIRWNELKRIIRPINNALNGGLCIGISSCSGFNACRMAMDSDLRLPFFGLVGPTNEIPFSDVAIAFVTFYYRLLKKRSTGVDAIMAMKIASKNNNFGIILASQARGLWDRNLRYIINQLNPYA